MTVWKRRTEHTTSNEIGARLLTLRLDASMTQAQFADALGVSPRTYHHYERGTRSVSAEILISLHEVFGVDPSWVLLGIGLPKPSEEGRILAEFVADLSARLAVLDADARQVDRERLIEGWLFDLRASFA